jgi:hypothetical protein
MVIVDPRAMPTRQRTSLSFPSGRRVVIHVVDANDNPIPGSDILFSINRVPVGGVRSSAGSASLDMPESSVVVDVSAVVGHSRRVLICRQGLTRISFVSLKHVPTSLSGRR